MAPSQDNRLLKIFFAVIILLFVLLAYWSFTTYQENEDIKGRMTVEKERIEKELKNISLEYTDEINKGNILSKELSDARERIINLRDSVINLEGSVEIMSRLRQELVLIKEQRSELYQDIKELEEANTYLVRINDSTLAALNQEINKNELREETVEKLNKNIKKAANLLPVNFSTEGVIVRRSGKQIVNDNASRVDDLKVCFTLPENELAKKGVNYFYLQIINPENNVMGAGRTIDFEGKTLKYSKIIEFNYQGLELDICEMLGADVERIVKGTYRINLFNGPIRVSNTTIDFR